MQIRIVYDMSDEMADGYLFGIKMEVGLMLQDNNVSMEMEGGCVRMEIVVGIMVHIVEDSTWQILHGFDLTVENISMSIASSRQVRT